MKTKFWNTKVFAIAATGMSFILVLLFAGCRHGNDPEMQHDRPLWTVADTTDLESTMTITGTLPKELADQADTCDLVAAFADTECWGVTPIQYVDNRPYFFLFVNRPHSKADQSQALTLRYYSAKTRYIYVEKETFIFTVDAIFGSISAPIVPTFNQKE